MYCLTAACEEVKYKAFYCGRDRKSEDFPEEYCMIDCVKCFRVVKQEAQLPQRNSALAAHVGYPDILVSSIVPWVRTLWLVLWRSRGVTRPEAARSRPITRQLQFDVTSEATSGY